jgi:nephrocystin-3
MDIDQNRNVRIFVSSTFRDMNNERNYLMGVIFPELIRIARKRNINVSIIDLRWGITDEEALKKLIDMCLSQIDNSRPHFIGIIGDRYGYIPKKEIINRATIPNTEQKHKWAENNYSITHIEMDYGVLSKPEMDKFAYFYFKSLNRKPDNQKDAEKLYDLIQTIKVENAPWHWNKLPFNCVKELGEQVKKDFIDMLDIYYPVKALTPLELERSYYTQYSRFLLRNYVEDTNITKTIIKNIDKYGSVLVTGEVGTGKSSVLAYTKIEYEKKYPDALIIQHYIGVAGSSTSRGIAIHILREIREWVNKSDGSFTKEIPSDEDEIYHALLDWQSLISKSNRPLLIIDGLDQLNGISDSRFLGYLHKIKILASCRDSTPMLEHLKILNFRKAKLEGLTKNRKILIIKNVLNSIGKKLEDEQVEKIACSGATKNPLYLRTLLDELIRIGTLKKPNENQLRFIDRQIDTYLSATTLTRLYNKVLHNLDLIMDKYFNTPDITANILKLIAASRYGLSENEIALILGVDMVKIEAIKNYLDYHLAVKNNNIDFLHSSLRQAIYKKYLARNYVEKQTREIIVNWFLSQEPDERQLDEVPYQLYSLKDKDKLKEYLSQIKIFSLFIEKYPGVKYFELIAYLRFSLGNGYICDSIINMYDQARNSEDPLLLKGLGTILKNYYCLKQAATVFSLAMKIDNKTHTNFIDSDLADNYSNMGKVYSFLKEYKKAEASFKKAIEINRKLHDNIHPDIARDLSNLGAVYRCQGINAKAEQLFKEAIEINRKFYGDDHPDIARDLGSLAAVYRGEKRFGESEKLVMEAIEINRKFYGDDHPDIARDLGSLAAVYRGEKRFGESEKLFKEAKEIERKFYGDDHPNIAKHLSSLGEVYKDQKKYKKAEAEFILAIGINKKFFGTEHPDIARDLLQLAECYYGTKSYDRALSMFKRAYKIHKKYFPEGSPDIARELKGQGLIYIRLKKYSTAEVNFRHSISIYGKLFGYVYPEIAFNLTGLAHVNIFEGNCSESLKNFRKAKNIFIKLSKDNNIYSENIKYLEDKIRAVIDICKN